MASTSDDASLSVPDAKASAGMKRSLETLAKLLQCPICHKLFDKPTTLASCAHSFCVSCIDQYCSGSWVCPVEDCRMPMSIVGGHRGSYRKINPQLSQSVESLKVICCSLNRAPDDWWKSESALKLAASEEEPPIGRDGGSSDEESLVDVQQKRPRRTRGSVDNPQDDLQDSDWES